jgi:hypothetical protein
MCMLVLVSARSGGCRLWIDRTFPRLTPGLGCEWLQHKVRILGASQLAKWRVLPGDRGCHGVQLHLALPLLYITRVRRRNIHTTA